MIARVFTNGIRSSRTGRVAAVASRTPGKGQALAWVLAQPFPVFPIIGPRRPDEITDCLRALVVVLTPAERDWLNADGPEADTQACK